ncbi:MAG: type 4a pilus biogenesis protein PilO [bacterium]
MSIRKKTIILLSVIFIAISAITFFIIIPTIKNIKNISLKINSMRFEVEKKYDNRVSLRAAMKKFKLIQESAKNFLNIYVKKNEELNLITTLENIAEKNKLSQKINLIYNEKQKKYLKNQTEIQIIIAGNYIDIIKYLRDLRIMPYYINFNSIAINKLSKNDKTPDNVAQASLSGNFFMLPE